MSTYKVVFASQHGARPYHLVTADSEEEAVSRARVQQILDLQFRCGTPEPITVEEV